MKKTRSLAPLALIIIALLLAACDSDSPTRPQIDDPSGEIAAQLDCTELTGSVLSCSAQVTNAENPVLYKWQATAQPSFEGENAFDREYDYSDFCRRAVNDEETIVVTVEVVDARGKRKTDQHTEVMCD